MAEAVKANALNVELGGKPILKNLNFTLTRGRIIGLLGPNGAGKTTLMRTIVGRQSIANGEVEVLGSPAGSPQVRPRVGYMTQAVAIYSDLTVMENLQYFAAMTDQPQDRINEVIKSVELTSFTGRLASRLSGGQRSRVSLAIALIGQPELLVLDEPTVGLDPSLRQRLWQMFDQLAADGITILVSSHVMDEASHCDELLFLREGELLAQGTLDEILAKTESDNIETSFIKLAEGKS